MAAVEFSTLAAKMQSNVTSLPMDGCSNVPSTEENLSTMQKKVLGCIINQSTECTISYWIYVIGVPALILFGTIGNILTVAVMTTSYLHKSAFGIYIIAIAIADTLVLWTTLPRHFIRWIWLIDIRQLNLWSCRTLRFLQFSIMNVSAWLLVVVTTERFLTVYFPNKFRSYKSRYKKSRRAWRIVTAVTLFHFAWNAHIFWTLGEERVDKCKTKLCGYPTAATAYYWKHVHTWVDATKLSLLPFVLMLAMNVAIMVNLRRRSLERDRRRAAVLQRTRSVKGADACDDGGAGGSAGASGKQAQKHSASDSKTLMLLWVSFFYVVMTVPTFVSTALEHARIGTPLVSSVTTIALYVNNAMNFILYSLSGAEFRRLFAQALCRRARSTAEKRRYDATQVESVAMCPDISTDSGTAISDDRSASSND